MNKIMWVINEAHIREKKMRETSRKERSDEIKKRTRRAKALITMVKKEE